MFIRIKKIKGMEYAYLVKSVWKNNVARQKVVKYLGKVLTPAKTHALSFPEFCQKEDIVITKTASYQDILAALFAWALYQHGFVKDPLVQKKWIFEHGKISGDPEKLKLMSGKKEVTVKMNEGYMASYTLKELLKIDLSKKVEEQREAGTRLAKAFVAAGIEVPQDVFIEVFQKLYQ